MRYLMLDRVTELSPPEFASAVKCISLADDVFVDHFPGHPVMPGALILEGLAQLGGVLVEASMRAKGRNDLHALLVMVDNARFRRAARPGDQLIYEARGKRVSEDGGKVTVVAKLEGKTAASAELGYAFAEVKHERLIARRREILNVWLTGSSAGDE